MTVSDSCMRSHSKVGLRDSGRISCFVISFLGVMSVRLVIGAVLILKLATGASFAAGPADAALRCSPFRKLDSVARFQGLQREVVNATDSDGDRVALRVAPMN
jgi:hypothetical protein